MTVDTGIAASEDLFGKHISDLQSDVVVDDAGSKITGTLNYISDYTGFSSKVSEQSGNYIALHITVPGAEGVTLRAGLNKMSTLDSDGIIVLRVADKDSQTIIVVASKDGYESVTKTFSLTELICVGEPDNTGSGGVMGED